MQVYNNSEQRFIIMQVLKEETRKKIIEVAIEEFYQYGYNNTNLRNVASKSHMTVGNIYRYFKNKEELFLASTKEAFDAVKHLITDQSFLEVDFFENKQSMEMLSDRLVRVLKHYPKELIIILQKSDGVMFETVVRQMEVLIARRITQEISTIRNAEALMLAHLVLSGLTRIFALFGEDELEMRREIISLLHLLFYQIETRV